MPKSGNNSRPYNRDDKKEVARNAAALKKAGKAGTKPGDSSYDSVGPGRGMNSGASARQKTREVAGEASTRLGQRMRVRGGMKK
jgi:hypothetical protein